MKLFDSSVVTTFSFQAMNWPDPTPRPDRRLAATAGALVVLFLAVAVGRAQTIYTWSGGDIATGTISPASVSTIGAADTFNITTGADHNFNGFLLTNNGTVSWQAGNLRSGNGGTITNNATWNDSQNGYQFNNAYGGAGGTTFNNSVTGTYNKTAGTTDFLIGFTNAGTINVTGGALNLDVGGTFADGSVVGSSGGGVLQLLGGTLAMNGNITATNFLFNGGTLAGNQNFVASTLNWQTGDWNSANTTTLGANTTLTISSGADHSLNSHTVVNNGTINWTAGNVRSGNGGSITNNGTWNDTNNGYQVNNAYGGVGGTTFVNAAGGTYNKLSGTTGFEVGFTNFGAVVVSGGTLNLDAGGTFYGGSSIGSTGAGVVQLTGGVLTAGDPGGFTATNFLLTSGELSGVMTFLGTTNWVASDFNTPGTATIGATGTINITTGNDHNLNGHALVNNGTVNWTAGNVRSGNGGVITNNATWNDSSNGYQVNDAYGGTGGTIFHNAATGIYNKTGGTTTLADNVLVNDGIISVTGGVLNLSGGVLNNSSSIGSSGGGVVQLTGSVLTANGTVNVQNFILNGGQLTGTQTFVGTISWLTGDLNTAGSMTINNGSTLTIATGADHNYNGHAIVNNGIVNWTAGNVRSGNGGIITNNGLWNDTSDTYQINGAYGGAGGATFHNTVSGVYSKTTGTTTLADGVLVNDGTISVSGGVLNLVGGVLNSGSSFGSSGSGVVQLTGGVLTANGAVNVQNLLLNAGQLTGNQTFNGSLTWVATDLNTTASTAIGSGSTLTIAGGNDHNFNSHTITNNGTVNWTAGNVRSGNGGIITNNGVWNDTSNTYAINGAYGGTGGATFHNTGVYNKTTGTTTLADGVLVNDGTVSVSGGVLNLIGGALHNGSSIGSSGTGVVQLTGGVLTAGGVVNVQNFLFNGGEIAGNPTFVGSLSWLAGDLNLAGTMTIGVAGTFTIGTGNDHNFNTHSITNAGTVDWVAGNLRAGNGSVITNYGVWNDSSDTYQINDAYGGAGGTTFVNAVGGTYNKTGGVSSLAVPLTNLGLINITGGTLALSGGYSDAAGRISLASGTSLSSTTPLNFSSGSLLMGNGTVAAPFFSLSGAIKPGTLTTAGQLTLNGNLALLAPAFTEFEIGGVTPGTQYDALVVNGTLSLGGHLQIGFINGFEGMVNSSMIFDLISSTALSSSFVNVANGSRLTTADGLGSFVVNYGAGSSFGVNDVVLTNFAPVPEPSTWALLLGGSGVVALAFRRRRAG